MNLKIGPQKETSREADSTPSARPASVVSQRSTRRSQPASKTISRTTVNFILDCALLLVFMALLWTAVIVHFVFPPGPDAAGWTLWGLSFVQWSDLHFSVLSTLALGVLVHVMLHWTWVCGVATKALHHRRAGKLQLDDGTRTLIGVATLIIILHVVGLGVAAAWLSIQSPLLN